jgi:hypothetical protein
MELEAISGAATVALTSTIVFLLIAKTWSTVARTVSSTPSFSDRIMRESAQRFRDEFERLSSSQQIYLSGTLVFVMLFVAAYVLKARELFAGYPSWQLYLQLGFIVLTAGYAVYRLIKTISARYRVSFVRDANIAIGHQLQQLSAGATRVYHDVETSAGVVDHVIVSQNGVYAVNVVARRHHKAASARLVENSLQFSNSQSEVSIVDLVAKSKRLQKEFRQLLGHKVRVRSVIALPGWEIGEQNSRDHLLVNESNIAMLSGWKDNSDHLMNEDAELLHQELRSRCVRA